MSEPFSGTVSGAAASNGSGMIARAPAEMGCATERVTIQSRNAPRIVLPSPFTCTSIAETPIIGSSTLSEDARSIPDPRGADCKTCEPDSSQIVIVGC